MNELLRVYQNKLDRKERLIQEYIEEKNSIDGFISSKHEIEYNILYAEIELLRKFIEDLKELK